jgi:hypothetical protein
MTHHTHHLPTQELMCYQAHPGTKSRTYRALRASVAAEGVKEPLELRTDGEFVVIGDGHQRLAAAQELRITELPIVIKRVTFNWHRRVKHPIGPGLTTLLKEQEQPKKTVKRGRGERSRTKAAGAADQSS